MNTASNGLLPVMLIAALGCQLGVSPAEGQQTTSGAQVAVELLGRRPGLLPWEGGRDVIGLGARALRRRFRLTNDPVETESRIRLSAPDGLGASVWIEPLTDMRPGDVRAYHVDGEVDDATHRALRAHLVELYGEPRVHRSRRGARGLAFGDAPRARRIVLWNIEGPTVITVERFLSLATLVGQGRPTVGLGGRNWMSGRSARFERTCTRAGWWYSSDAECVLPPTEFSHRGRLVAGDGAVRLELKMISQRSDFEALEADLVRVLAQGFGEATAVSPLPGFGSDIRPRYRFASGAVLYARIRGLPGTVNIEWVFEHDSNAR